MSREIKRKINSIKKKRVEALRKRVEAIVERFGYQLQTDEEAEQDERAYLHMINGMTPTEKEDYLEFMWPSVMEKLQAAKDILIHPIFKSCVIDQILPVAVQLHKSQDDFELMWKLRTLWMWCSDPIIYREWMEAFGNPKFERMPDNLVIWYKELKLKWDDFVEASREARIQKLRDEVTSLSAEIADPVNKSEHDYIRDCEADIKDIRDMLKEIEVLG